jgi:hypothetical protein
MPALPTCSGFTDAQLEERAAAFDDLTTWNCTLPFKVMAAQTAAALRELIERRKPHTGLRALEKSLAYEHACSVIAGGVAHAYDEDGQIADHYDLGNVDSLAAQHVKDAVLYLELRGLLTRDSEDTNCVFIHDEEEADEEADDSHLPRALDPATAVRGKDFHLATSTD